MASKEIWVIAKITQDKLQECTIEVLSDARMLARQFSGKLCAVVVGEQTDNLAEIFKGRLVDSVYSICHSLLMNYTTDGYVLALTQLVNQYRPFMILGSAGSDTDDFMPRLAAHINCPLVPGCVQISVEQDQNLLFIRPSHMNKVYTTITCTGNPPFMATYVPGVIGIEAAVGENTPEVITFSPQLSQDSLQTSPIATIQGNPETIDIREANIIVSGGKGACVPSAWEGLKNLAAYLGASIGGTRMALDLNFIQQDRLIGQTGKFVNPKVYLAAGISGAYYHMHGINTEHLIAINNDRFAPIFSQCNYGIVGNLDHVIPALCRIIETGVIIL